MAEAKLYPALDIVWRGQPHQGAVDLLLADLDAFAPTAIDELPAGIRAFFGSEVERDLACDSLAATHAEVTVQPREVSDEAWAERSQAALGPVHVGPFVVAPPWSTLTGSDDERIVIRIQPSMGFGTGHHASTRLCLQLLQGVALSGRPALDVGTGSGVLAIAAWRLGAVPVVAIDVDEDALTSARENKELNRAAITVRAGDILRDPPDPVGPFHTVTANLTGALLQRAAPPLSWLVEPGGALIASGFQDEEFEPVTRSLEAAGFTVEMRADEDRWVGVRFRKAPA